MTYAMGGRTLARYLRKPEWQRTVDKASGGMFILFGVSLLAWRHR